MRRGLHVITNSELGAWRKCHAYHGFAYAEGLRPLVKPEPLAFGNIYHAGAAAGWRAAWSSPHGSQAERLDRALAGAAGGILRASEEHMQDLRETALSPDDHLDELLGQTEEHRDIALWAVGHYFERAAPDLNLVPVAVEAPFRVHIPNKAGQASSLIDDGVIDLVLWDRMAGVLVIQDHKSTSNTVQSLEAKLLLDTQLTGYLVALQLNLEAARYYRRVDSWRADPGRDLKTGLVGDFWEHMPPGAQSEVEKNQEEFLRARTGALCFNVVRKAKPHTPKLNLLAKKWAVTEAQKILLAQQEDANGEPAGEVSVAQIDTTPEVYEAALMRQYHERGLAVTDKQKALLEGLRRKPDSYYYQHEFYRGPLEIERWRAELWVEARRIRKSLRDPRERTRNPLACTGTAAPPCVYRAVCLAPDSPEARAGFRVAQDVHEEVREAEEQATL